MAITPASIRSKNPGAMWGKGRNGGINPLAAKWGCVRYENLSDGTGQGNNIAVFPDYVHGIAAQLDLWRSSPRYRNKRFDEAIKTWSGGNNVEAYIAYVQKRVPGLQRGTILNDAFWLGPMGVPFLKAQASHEAGREYPAPNEDWFAARMLVYKQGGIVPRTGPVPEKPKPKPKPPDTSEETEKKAWYQKGIFGWLLGLIAGSGMAIGDMSITDTLIYAFCLLLVTLTFMVIIWVYLLPPRGSFKVKTPWDS